MDDFDAPVRLQHRVFVWELCIIFVGMHGKSIDGVMMSVSIGWRIFFFMNTVRQYLGGKSRVDM